jgi:hypothetical protein
MEKRKAYVQKNSGCMVAVLVTVGSLLGGSVIYALA